jgi:hypothetical protein
LSAAWSLRNEIFSLRSANLKVAIVDLTAEGRDLAFQHGHLIVLFCLLPVAA